MKYLLTFTSTVLLLMGGGPFTSVLASNKSQLQASENASSSADQHSPAPPNIVMIISDDQRWTDYSFMGHEAIQTPALDQLAARSATFRRGYVPVALCRPSLATMITGLYPFQHKITGNDPARTKDMSNAQYNQLRSQLIANIDAVPTLPKLLAEKGYVSFQSGKWWEGSFSRGGFTQGMSRGFPEQGGRHGDDGLKIGRNGMQPVLEFIDSATESQKPFFLWYAPFLPHTPHNPPDRLLKKYAKPGRPVQLAKYYAMCHWFDETCGTLIDHLDKTGLAENTLIVYVTDNGWIQRTSQSRVPDGWKSVFAPRSKQSPYDGGTRTPILISWPKKMKAQEYPDLVSSIDLIPTMLQAAGAEVPANLPGVSLLPLTVDGTALQRDTIFGESYAHDVADLDDVEASLLYRWVISGHWKLLLAYDGKTTRYGSVHDRTNFVPALYNLQDDPFEKENVAKQQPAVVEALKQKLDNWYRVKSRQVIDRSSK